MQVGLDGGETPGLVVTVRESSVFFLEVIFSVKN